jgi:DNA-binding CsgD family transcriptional regulator
MTAGAVFRRRGEFAILLINATFEFIERLDQQSDGPSLVGSFQELIGRFGMGSFLMGNPERTDVAPEERLWATTWPDGWLQHWTEQRYMLVDPVLKQIMTKSDPVRWSDIYGAGNKTGSRIMKEANEHGLRDGFALPIYSRDGFVVAISMAAEHYDLGKQDESCLHMASIFFHAKLERMRAKEAPPRAPRLTPRERECLVWVASGKTDWEISQILNIAEQTVHEYVQNALIKLNATTRAQAVAIAIFSKQITA